jgi:hypothetical protein
MCPAAAPGARTDYPATALQDVHGVTPGVTYRFGVWSRLWSSTGTDHFVSENPEPMDVWVCISPKGSLANPWDSELSVCSAPARPYDTWQYLSVDAVAQEEHIVVWLMMAQRTNEGLGMGIWDDASLTASTVAATPTPAAVRPTRPAPVPFDANALYDAMLQARSDMEQMGGLLDRAVNEGAQSCDPYVGWYDSLVASPVYDGVPAEWGGVYTEYLWAIEHLLEKSSPIIAVCTGDGGYVTNLEYGVGRMGINESLDRLCPAIETAAAMLGR